MKKISSGYIISVVSAILLLLEVIGVKVDVPYVNQIVMAVLGVLIALGIVSSKQISGQNKVDNKENTDKSDNNVVENLIDEDGEKMDDQEERLTKIISTIDSQYLEQLLGDNEVNDGDIIDDHKSSDPIDDANI